MEQNKTQLNVCKDNANYNPYFLVREIQDEQGMHVVIQVFCSEEAADFFLSNEWDEEETEPETSLFKGNAYDVAIAIIHELDFLQYEYIDSIHGRELYPDYISMEELVDFLPLREQVYIQTIIDTL